ncbi:MULTISPECIES: hypothetical protein [Arsenicicoccus]|uniref:hypothetical protein n=3 Tax=Intrasporangiaceae TaxID=85021 RepID=UPI0025804D6A|nr:MULTISPECIES: hypothetical protein [Arsenicicoccus]
MSMPRPSVVAYYTLAVIHLGCVRAWISAFDPTEDLSGELISGMILGLGICVLSPLLARRIVGKPSTGYDLLSDEDKAVVDEALAAGEQRGRVTLRAIERERARERLGDNPRFRSMLWWIAAILAVPYVVMPFTATRPAWLVAVTIITTVCILLFAFLRRKRVTPDLPEDERRRLRAVAKARP